MVWYAKAYAIDGVDDGFDRGISQDDARGKLATFVRSLAGPQLVGLASLTCR